MSLQSKTTHGAEHMARSNNNIQIECLRCLECHVDCKNIIVILESTTYMYMYLRATSIVLNGFCSTELMFLFVSAFLVYF